MGTETRATRRPHGGQAAGTARAPRPLRGLLLGFALSVLNLLGTWLVLVALGGPGPWTAWQFIGLFGLLEVGTGIAFIIGPNIWRLPVAEANTSPRTPVHLAASTVFIPHWGAGAKAVAGLALLAGAAAHEGVGMATAGIPALVLLIVIAVEGLSLITARLGVARPDLDVLFIVVHRPGHPERALPGISLGASCVQLLINIGAYPAVKALPPTVFYRPEIGPAPALLVGSAGAALVLLVGGWLAWRGRIARQAPAEQQREADESA
jgi:hypothetical protein